VIFRYMIPSVVSQDRPSAAYGILGSTFSASMIFGSLLGGFLLSTSGFALPFYVASAGAVAASAPLWLSRMGSRPAQVQADTPELPTTNRGRKLELVFMGGMAMSAFLIFSVFYTMIPLVMTQPPIRAGPFEVGVLLAVFNVSMLLFQPLTGHTGAFKPRAWMSAGLLTGVSSFLILVFARSTILVYGAAFLAGISFSSISTHSLARFTKLVHRSRRGAAIGVYGAAEDIGVILGPLVFSFLWTTVSLAAALSFIALVLLAVLIAYAFPRQSLSMSASSRELISQEGH